ncbi:TetR/AcrR family transcriptional regulator [Frondihabitans cladoniiphilus]|uniref:TetR/AcrR family transcriptional regulator n=1 Tax=Frondihabitans cladoniiphilus TaxID=715785 RepID=UPI0031EC50C4
MLDAAAVIIDDIGYERLTTAMVAEKAGASIGTVYRYFPDRIAVVEALAIRCVQRLVERVAATVESDGVTDWRGAVDVLIDSKVEMYRNEPGFRAVTFGDFDTAERAGGDGRLPLAAQIADFLVERFEIGRTTEFEFAVEIVTEIGSALISRAFLTVPEGDTRYIEQCRVIAKRHLESVTGPSA